MTRIWSAAVATCALSLAVALVAQTSTPSQTSPQASKTVTVTGCIQRAPAAPAPTGTAGTTPSSAATTKFLLTDVAMGTTGTAGTAGASSSTKASEYRLDADDAKLTPHVGHKVEIAGTLDESPSPSTAPAGTSSSAESRSPKLKVDTVRMIAATCP
jgi:hypothetical protein